MLPILITAAVSGVVGSLIGIAGTKRVCWVWIYWYDWADWCILILHVDSAVMSIILIIIGFLLYL